MFAKCHGVPAHLLIVGVVIAAITPVRLALTERYAEERHRIEAQGRNQRTRELVAKWNALRYADITDENFADDIVAAIHSASLNLSEVQKVKLEQRLRDVFGYLQNPTFEEYYRLKTEALHYQFEPGKITSARLRKVALVADRAGKLEPREILKPLWDATMTPTAQAPTRITGVCLDYVSAAISRTNSLAAIVSGKAGKCFTIAQEGVDLGLQYMGTGRPTSGDPPRPLYFHLSVFGRSNVSKYAGPVYVSLYWSEVDQKWALSRMFTDVLLKMNLVY